MKATLATLIALTAASAVSAQTTGALSDYRPAAPTHHYGSPPTFYHHASTEAEGTFRGWADYVRALGENRFNTAAAMNLYQDARRRALQNDLLHAQIHFARKEANRAARYPQRDPAEIAARRERVTAWGRPNRLSPSQFRPELGQLIWPDVLRDPAFDDERREIDLLVRQSVPGYAAEITAQTRKMEDKLDAMFHLVGQESYLQGRKFLKSLLREVRESTRRGVAVASR